MPETEISPLPRDDLFRALYPGVELRVDSEADDQLAETDDPILFGYFIRFNEWTEINSYWEGHFLERFAPGSCKKTLREGRDSIRCLFQHGYDFTIGDKPLGPWQELREDGDEGVYYEVPLLDAPYVREDLLPGLRAGLYGASVRFSVLREEVDKEPGESEHNPKGLPERTIKECRIYEGGPVTFPAYGNASAGVRSVSDEFHLLRAMRSDPDRVRELLITTAPAPQRADTPAPSDPGPDDQADDRSAAEPTTTITPAPSEADAEAKPHLAQERRGKRIPLYGTRLKEADKPWIL